MKHTELIRVVDGTIPHPAKMAAIIRASPTGNYLFTWEPKNKRTHLQNNYLHTLFPIIQEGLYNNGYREIRTAAQAKEACKMLFLSYEVDNGTGGTMKMVRRTRDLTREQMSAFIDDILFWASDSLGIYIPPPGEQNELFSVD